MDGTGASTTLNLPTDGQVCSDLFMVMKSSLSKGMALHPYGGASCFAIETFHGTFMVLSHSGDDMNLVRNFHGNEQLIRCIRVTQRDEKIPPFRAALIERGMS